MLRIYNSLTRKIEEFKPLNTSHTLPAERQVGMYTCGPTVYSFVHIGNFRTYTMADLLLRTLKANGFEVKYVMNLTDVGHLTGDNSGDADLGEDRMEKSAKKEGKTAWEVAEFYTQAFLTDFKALNLSQPEIFCKATEHIQGQIDLVKKLEEKGFTYETADGIYFDTSKFKNYGQLSDLDHIKEGARVEINQEKRNPRDFALWKFSKSEEKRQMEWDSPWGKGFPGWHIECSAMSMQYLGASFDIHTGGMDLKSTHHPNEIAQSEAASGKMFVKYWMHCAFMLVSGEKMSKSKGNVYRVYDLENQGYDPLALRYLYLQTHYRQEMNFTYPALTASQNALNHLREIISSLDEPSGNLAEYENKFMEAINNDLNLPEALSVLWEMLKSDNPSSHKSAALMKMDEILGLNLSSFKQENKVLSLNDLPLDVQKMITEREEYRKNKQYTKADHLRNKIKKSGYDLIDQKNGYVIKKINTDNSTV